MNRSLAVLVSAVAGACAQAPDPGQVRDVRPGTVEIGEKLLIETSVPLQTGAPTEVILEGAARRPVQSGRRAKDQPFKLVLKNARATAPEGTPQSYRVLVDIDPLVEEEAGGHVSFYGRVSVLQAGKAVATSRVGVQLDLFPRSSRKLAYDLVGGQEARGLAGWLGLALHQVPAPDGKGTAMAVEDVEQAFNALQFLSTYDCGVWQPKEKVCRGGLDGRVDEGESGAPPKLFAVLDEDHDKRVDRKEAHEHDRPPSPAAAAGIQPGDLIVAAAGRPVRAIADLNAAWKQTGDRVQVDLLRQGKPYSVSLPRYGQPASIPTGFLLGGILVALALLVILPVPVIGGLIVVWERKIAGRMQSRPGPNRVGPSGWLQWLADGVKLIIKEDIVPTDSDPVLFRASPYLVFMGVFSTFVVLPFSQMLIVGDLNIGILYLLSVTSLVVVGIIMGGWASNSKWSLLGGMRSAAQIISYELPASIAILSVVTLSGTLSTQGIVLAQGGAPWHWHLFDNPFTFSCFFIFFISALAEGNRTPFDLPEAESELVAGYNTEYSGFRFSIFFLAEWVNLLVIGSVATTVFLGGWQIPGVSPLAIEGSTALQLLSFAVFFLKAFFLVFVIIWVRWTLPRFRVDQMMNMCWKYFLPISLASLVAVTALEWLAPLRTMPREVLRFAMFLGLGGLIVGYFIKRVLHVRKTTRVFDLRGA